MGSRRFNRKMTYSGWRYPRQARLKADHLISYTSQLKDYDRGINPNLITACNQMLLPTFITPLMRHGSFRELARDSVSRIPSFSFFFSPTVHSVIHYLTCRKGVKLSKRCFYKRYSVEKLVFLGSKFESWFITSCLSYMPRCSFVGNNGVKNYTIPFKE